MKAAGEQAASVLYQLLGLGSLLQSPPVDNPRNVVDFTLFHMHHQVNDAFKARQSHEKQQERSKFWCPR